VVWNIRWCLSPFFVVLLSACAMPLALKLCRCRHCSAELNSPGAYNDNWREDALDSAARAGHLHVVQYLVRDLKANVGSALVRSRCLSLISVAVSYAWSFSRFQPPRRKMVCLPLLQLDIYPWSSFSPRKAR
jgi:hypothetical protein